MTAGATDILDGLLEAVPGGVVHVAADGAILKANPEACSFLGLGFDELLRRYTQDFQGDTWYESGEPCPAADYPVTIALVEKRRAGPTTIGVGQPDGSVRWAVFRAVPMKQGGAVVTFLDITERRATEQRLRTADRLASLGRLAAGVAHEINNPLTWVSLSLERAVLGDDVAACLRDAQDGLERVAAIVRDMGSFARVDDHRSEPFDVGAAVDKAVSVVGTQVRNLAVLEVADGLGSYARGVELRVVQVLVNLLLNAAQAEAVGPREAHRVWVRGGAADGEVWLEVVDNGQGMDTHTQEHAFDPFYTTKGAGRGTGLGLSISHALAEAMGGRLTLSSRLGQGTTVRLSLPRAAAPPLRPATPVASEGLRRKVLVVDDDDGARRAMVWALRGHEVVSVGGGREALERLHGEPFDALVCDMMMPGMSGMEVFDALLSAGHPLAGRMLVVTGGAYTPEGRAFLARSDVSVLAKPFGASELNARLEQLFVAAPATGEPAV